MLSSCRAFVVAQSEPQNRSLLRLAARAGFGFVGTVFGQRAVSVESEQSGLAFFFVHHLIPDGAMLAMLHRIRASDNDSLRYAPIFLVINDCPMETVLKYIRLGYNDVLTLPESREAIIARVMAQLSGEHLYIETGSYFGPDRRRMDFGDPAPDARPRVGSSHMRIHVTRSIEKGVQVIRKEIVGRRLDAVNAPRVPMPHPARMERYAGR